MQIHLWVHPDQARKIQGVPEEAFKRVLLGGIKMVSLLFISKETSSPNNKKAEILRTRERFIWYFQE